MDSHVVAMLLFMFVTVRIKCRELVKKIAIYRHRLAVSKKTRICNITISLEIIEKVVMQRQELNP